MLPAELGWTFFAAQDLLDEFEFEFWWVNFAAHEISFGEGSPRSFRRGYWSQAPGFTSNSTTSDLGWCARARPFLANTNSKVLSTVQAFLEGLGVAILLRNELGVQGANDLPRIHQQNQYTRGELYVRPRQNSLRVVHARAINHPELFGRDSLIVPNGLIVSDDDRVAAGFKISHPSQFDLRGVRDRKTDVEGRTLPDTGLERDLATQMSGDDVFDDRQSQAGAAPDFFGRVQRLENPWQHLGWDATAVVLDAEQHPF